MEFVVCKNNNRNRRIAEILRQFKMESVIVDENGIQWFVKKLFWDSPFKLIEPYIQENQFG